MQEDNKFKALLMKGAVKETSHDFTAETMRRIEAVSAAKLYDQPLVNYRIWLAFTIIFTIILSAIITVSIFIKPSDLPPAFFIKVPLIKIEDFYKYAFLISSFWILMVLNNRELIRKTTLLK